MTYKEITFEEWDATYKPLQGFDGISMLETYGADLELVMETDPHYVWTFVDGGEYVGYTAGVSYVNRLGYIICEVPWDNEDLYVNLYEEPECISTGEHDWHSDITGGRYCDICGEEDDN